jgi:hypothetical protein
MPAWRSEPLLGYVSPRLGLLCTAMKRSSHRLIGEPFVTIDASAMASSHAAEVVMASATSGASTCQTARTPRPIVGS